MVEAELEQHNTSKKLVRLTNRQKRVLVEQAREKGLFEKDTWPTYGGGFKWNDERAGLTDTEHRILRWRFPEVGSGLTLEQVGKEFGKTRERIRQIEKSALIKLQYQFSKLSE